MKLVEDKFDLNDYFVIFAVIITWALFFLLPKVLSKQVTILIFLYSLTVSAFFDNSVGADPWDFYDIMDGPDYTVMDVVVYFLYPPFSYLFIFIYKRFKIKDRYLIVYIPCFTAAAIGVEWIYHKMRVFEYKSGNNIFYSICVYLTIQSVLIVFYRYLSLNQKVN
jgi:hypothetical protein